MFGNRVIARWRARLRQSLACGSIRPAAGLGLVAAILLAAIGANVYFNLRHPEVLWLVEAVELGEAVLPLSAYVGEAAPTQSLD